MNAQPRDAYPAAGLVAIAVGTAGRMKSGNFGAVTTGAGMIFGAQALARTRVSRTFVSLAEALAEAERIGKILAQTIEKAARNVGDDRHFVVAGLVQDDAGVAVQPRDPLPVGGAVGVERHGDADDVERQPGRDGLD